MVSKNYAGNQISLPRQRASVVTNRLGPLEKWLRRIPNMLLDVVCLMFTKGYIMKQSELIERVAKKARTTKADARRMVDLVMGELESGVKEVRGNGSVSIPRVGTFRITSRSARMGRNPRTGEPMRIKASKSLRMRPAANLRKAAGC